VVTGDKVTGLNIGGLPWDENKTYRVATLDYLAEGNDGMLAFKQAFRTVNSYITLREVMIAYVKESAINNREIDAKLDNRISINP
jgi:2',3'-cyclic-nucleotide 2'-phosphodiesterase (5'-nucleotidase family)